MSNVRNESGGKNKKFKAIFMSRTKVTKDIEKKFIKKTNGLVILLML